jgi:putative ABC transport system permease protein
LRSAWFCSPARLLLKSFENMERQNLGVETQGVLTARIALPGFRYDTGQKKMEFYLQAEAAIGVFRDSRCELQRFGASGRWNNDERIAGLGAEGKPSNQTPEGQLMVVRGSRPIISAR